MCGFDSCYPCLSNLKKTKVNKAFKNVYGYPSLRINVLLKNFPTAFNKNKLINRLSAPRLGLTFRSYQPSKISIAKNISWNYKLPFVFFAVSFRKLHSSINFFKKQYLFVSLALTYVYTKNIKFFNASLFENFSFVTQHWNSKTEISNYLFYNQNSKFKVSSYAKNFNKFSANLNCFHSLFLSDRLLIEPYKIQPRRTHQTINLSVKFKRFRRFYSRTRILFFWARFLLKKLSLLVGHPSFNFSLFTGTPKEPNFFLPRYMLFNRLFFNELDFGDNGVKRYTATAYFLKSKDVFEAKVTRITRTQIKIEFSQFFNIKGFELSTYKKSNFNLFMSLCTSLFFNDSTLESVLTFETIKSTNFEFLRHFNRLNSDLRNHFYNCSLALFLENLESSLARLSLNVKPLLSSYEHQIKFNVLPKLVALSCANNNLKTWASQPRRPSFSLIPSYSNYFSTPITFNFLFTTPLFFKKFIFIKTNSTSEFNLKAFYQIFFAHVKKTFFYQEGFKLPHSNLLPHGASIINIRKIFLKVFAYQKFTPQVTPWYFNTFIRFIEHCSGKKTLFKVQGNLLNALNFEEKAKCLSWAPKLKNFRKLLGPSLFLGESLQILYTSLKLKDPYFLSNWMLAMFQKISFWKYKVFLRYFKYILRYFFWSSFSQLGVIGIKMQLKGKISVAGNARTRTVLQRTGKTGHATFNNKVVTTLSLVKTFTGVQGFKLWIFF